MVNRKKNNFLFFLWSILPIEASSIFFFLQVSTAVFQVLEKPPIISAAGFFEIDLSLIPSV